MNSQLFLLLLFIGHTMTSNSAVENSMVDGGAQDNESKVYYFKKMSGATCAYTASWLAHVNLFRRVTWYADTIRCCVSSSDPSLKYNDMIATFFLILQKGT